MDRVAIHTWFRGLTQHEKVIALLIIMHELTIVVRDIFISYPDDCERRWRLAYHLSEMNHQFTAAARQMMVDKTTYSDHDLVEMLLDQTYYPEIAPSCFDVMKSAMRLLNKK